MISPFKLLQSTIKLLQSTIKSGFVFILNNYTHCIIPYVVKYL
jgi:mannitol-specific phosphotransferase system IIBC component